MDYINPFSMVPQSSEFDSTNLLGVMNAQHKMDMAKPFIEMARQRQEMGNMQEAAKAGEFMSPQAMESRRTGLERSTAENQAATRVAPERAKHDVADYKAKLEAMPSMTAQKIAEAEQAAMAARGKPQAQLIQDLGNLQGALEKAPAQIRPMLYQEGISRWQQQHPGAKLPEQFQQYNEENMKLIRYASIHTAGHQQEIGKLQQQGANSLATQQLQNQGSAQVAGIQANASMRNTDAQIAAQQGKNPAAEKVRLGRILNNPNSPKEEIEMAQGQLEQIATEEFNKSVLPKDQPAQAHYLGLMQGTPGAEEKYDARSRKLWEDHLIKWGVRVKIQKPGGKVSTVPRSQLDQAKAEGYKEVK